jgi:hypothetical protein
MTPDDGPAFLVFSHEDVECGLGALVCAPHSSAIGYPSDFLA